MIVSSAADGDGFGCSRIELISYPDLTLFYIGRTLGRGRSGYQIRIESYRLTRCQSFLIQFPFIWFIISPFIIFQLSFYSYLFTQYISRCMSLRFFNCIFFQVYVYFANLPVVSFLGTFPTSSEWFFISLFVSQGCVLSLKAEVNIESASMIKYY